MATIRITDSSGIVLREYETPATQWIDLNPGERVVFVGVSIDDVGIANADDVNLAVTIDNFTVFLGRAYELLEQGEDVDLLFAEAFEDGRNPFAPQEKIEGAVAISGVEEGHIGSLDALIESAAGPGEPQIGLAGPTGDDGLGSDGRVSVGDLFPDHVRATGIEGEIPTVAFVQPEADPVDVPEEVPEPNDVPTARPDPDPSTNPNSQGNDLCVGEGEYFPNDSATDAESYSARMFASGNILLNDDFGDDGRGDPPISKFSYGEIEAVATDGVIEIDSGDGTWTLTLYTETMGPFAAGDYLFVLNKPLFLYDEEETRTDLVFDYTIQDGNGDTDSSTLTICVDHYPYLYSPYNLAAEDGGGAGESAVLGIALAEILDIGTDNTVPAIDLPDGGAALELAQETAFGLPELESAPLEFSLLGQDEPLPPAGPTVGAAGDPGVPMLPMEESDDAVDAIQEGLSFV